MKGWSRGRSPVCFQISLDLVPWHGRGTGLDLGQGIAGEPSQVGVLSTLQALGINNIFRDLTGLQVNQAAASGALDSVLGAAKSFSSHGLQLAQQRFLNSQMDRALSFVKQARDKNLLEPDRARDITADLFSKALGVKKPEEKAPTAISGAESFLDRIASGVSSAALRVVRAAGTVDLFVARTRRPRPSTLK